MILKWPLCAKALAMKSINQMVAPYLIEDIDEARIQLRAMETDGLLRRADLLAKINDYAVNEVGIAPEDIRYTGLLVLYNNMLQSLYKSQISDAGRSVLCGHYADVFGAVPLG